MNTATTATITDKDDIDSAFEKLSRSGALSEGSAVAYGGAKLWVDRGFRALFFKIGEEVFQKGLAERCSSTVKRLIDLTSPKP